MQYRTHQDITLSEIGVGCYALSGAYGQKDPEAYRQMLLRAIHSGVTFFDTADSYGEQAETLLGEVIRPFRQQIQLATKVGMRAGHKPDLSRTAVTAACEASLRRLNTEWIDLYQIHYDDPGTPVAETIGALEALVQSGKIRRYGIGHLPVERIRAYLATGQVFAGQFELSAVARDTRSEIVPLLQAHQARLIAFSVTGRGLLTGRFSQPPSFEPGDIRGIDPLFQRECYQSAVRTAARFTELGRLYGKSTVQTAIAWVLAQPAVLCALTGPSTVDHLVENLGGSGWQIAPEHLTGLEAFFDEEDRQLCAAQHHTVQAILRQPLSGDPSTAVQDLIYVMETAITAGWVSQDAVMPIFRAVYQTRKYPGADTPAVLERARQELTRLIQPAP